MKIIQNGSGVLVKHPVTPMIIMDHNRDKITNLHLIMNTTIIVMIELNEILHPIMRKNVKSGSSKYHS